MKAKIACAVFAQLFAVLTQPLSGQSPAHSELLIKPELEKGGVIEITCFDSSVGENRLVITALKLHVGSTGHNPAGSSPYFLGWYVDQHKPTKELWVGVELPAGSSSGTVSLALPTLLNTPGAFDSDVLLSISADPPDLSPYFANGSGKLVFAPVHCINLDFSNTKLKLIDFAGWQKAGIDKLTWKSANAAQSLLEARFSWTGPLDSAIEIAGMSFAGLMFGMFFTAFILLKWVRKRIVWIGAGCLIILASYWLWKHRWVGQIGYIWGVAGLGLGLLMGVILPERIVRRIHEAKSAEPG